MPATRPPRATDPARHDGHVRRGAGPHDPAELRFRPAAPGARVGHHGLTRMTRSVEGSTLAMRHVGSAMAKAPRGFLTRSGDDGPGHDTAFRRVHAAGYADAVLVHRPDVHRAARRTLQRPEGGGRASRSSWPDVAVHLPGGVAGGHRARRPEVHLLGFLRPIRAHPSPDRRDARGRSRTAVHRPADDRPRARVRHQPRRHARSRAGTPSSTRPDRALASPTSAAATASSSTAARSAPPISCRATWSPSAMRASVSRSGPPNVSPSQRRRLVRRPDGDPVAADPAGARATAAPVAAAPPTPPPAPPMAAADGSRPSAASDRRRPDLDAAPHRDRRQPGAVPPPGIPGLGRAHAVRRLRERTALRRQPQRTVPPRAAAGRWTRPTGAMRIPHVRPRRHPAAAPGHAARIGACHGPGSAPAPMSAPPPPVRAPPPAPASRRLPRQRLPRLACRSAGGVATGSALQGPAVLVGRTRHARRRPARRSRRRCSVRCR